tara:strand:- start:24957 stop:25703 length:747 start_codon:yes stop_codon:yes gene_type:complete
MNLFFLAAGTSGRILKISKGLPKPLIKIKNVSILERNIRWIKKYKFIKNYFINTYFKPHHIKNELKKIEKKLKIKIRISNEKKLLGTAGAIKKVEKSLGKSFLVIYSDNLLNFNLDKMIKFHNKKKSDITMALYSLKKNPFTGIASSSIKLDFRKRIVNFDEKRNSKGNSKYLVNTGVIILNNKIFKFIKKNQFVDLSNDVFKKIVNYKSIKFYGYQIEKKNSYCLAIDTPEAYKKLLKLIKKIRLIN